MEPWLKPGGTGKTERSTKVHGGRKADVRGHLFQIALNMEGPLKPVEGALQRGPKGVRGWVGLYERSTPPGLLQVPPHTIRHSAGAAVQGEEGRSGHSFEVDVGGWGRPRTESRAG